MRKGRAQKWYDDLLRILGSYRRKINERSQLRMGDVTETSENWRGLLESLRQHKYYMDAIIKITRKPVRYMEQDVVQHDKI